METGHVESGVETEADEPLVVYRSSDRTGATYALNLRVRERLRQQYGDAVHLPPRVFIAHETKDDYQRIHGSIRRQIVFLLTGLSEDRLAELGPIEFRDPVTEEEIK